MLVSAIGKFDAVKIMNNSRVNSTNTFNGDKNLDERCKPHYDIKSIEHASRTCDNNAKNNPTFCLMA